MQPYVDDDGIKRGLMRTLTRRFFLRFHVAVIVAWTFCCGLVLSKMLLAIGQESMAMRYGIALVFAYLMFLLAVRLWLQYAGYGRYLRGKGDVPLDAPVGGSPRTSTPSDIHPGGGDFGGAGASGSYDTGSAADASFVGDGADAAAGVAEGGLPGLIIALLIVIASALFALAAYLVASAPLVLVDAAFEALLAGGMIRGARRMDSASWVGTVVRATYIPFCAVFVLTIVAASVAQSHAPGATTLSGVLTLLLR